MEIPSATTAVNPILNELCDIIPDEILHDH